MIKNSFLYVYIVCCLNQKCKKFLNSKVYKILERNKTNYKRRIFLESLYSNIDKNSVNERMEFPRAYVPLLRSLGNQSMKQ